MVRDLSDQSAAIQDLAARVRRLESGQPQQDMSITEGMLRNVGGTIRIDTDALFELVGTMVHEGLYRIIQGGQLRVEDGGDVRLLNGGDLRVEDGGDVRVLDGGDVTVEEGGDLAVQDGGNITVEAGGEISVDGPVPLRLRQTNIMGVPQAALLFGTRVAFSSSGSSDTSNLLIDAGPSSIQMNANRISLSPGPDATVNIVGLPSLPAGTEAQYVVYGPGGQLYVSSGTGGGADPEPGEDLGHFQWPFPLSSVTSEYGPRNGRIHEGIDFGFAPAVSGAPIIAAGDGTVAVNTYSSGWGNYVRLTHTLTGGKQVSTLYAHMIDPGSPAVGSTVEKGDVIGYVGNTGNSFGAHLHWETWDGTTYGTHVNPRSFMAAYGEG